MTRESDRRKRSSRPVEASSPDLRPLLDEIEKEPVPDRLLELAIQLQKKLAEKRRHEEDAGTGGKTEARGPVKQSP